MCELIAILWAFSMANSLSSINCPTLAVKSCFEGITGLFFLEFFWDPYFTYTQDSILNNIWRICCKDEAPDAILNIYPILNTSARDSTPNNSSSQYSFNNSSTTISGKNELNPTLFHAHLVPIAIFFFIISFPPVPYTLQLVLPMFTIKFRSSSVTKSLPFYVASFGTFGRVFQLLQLAHFSENWAISSECSATFGE